MPGPVNVNSKFERIDQPAEQRAVFEVLDHLVANLWEPVSRGPKLDNEVRTDWRKVVLLPFRQTVPPFTLNPRSIG